MTVGAAYGREAERQEAARLTSQVINQVFWGTLLREFRNNQQPTILDSGPGNMTFIRQLDMELIKRMSRPDNSPLAAAVMRQLGVVGERQPGALRSERFGPQLSGRANG